VFHLFIYCCCIHEYRFLLYLCIYCCCRDRLPTTFIHQSISAPNAESFVTLASIRIEVYLCIISRSCNPPNYKRVEEEEFLYENLAFYWSVDSNKRTRELFIDVGLYGIITIEYWYKYYEIELVVAYICLRVPGATPYRPPKTWDEGWGKRMTEEQVLR